MEPSIWGDFLHFDDHPQLPSAIAFTDMAERRSTTPGIARQERWVVQLPEYLFDSYFISARDGQSHTYDWGFRNLGEIALVSPQLSPVPAKNNDGTPWDPFGDHSGNGYYRPNTGHDGVEFVTSQMWQADWTMNEGAIVFGLPWNRPDYANPPRGARLRLTMAAELDTKIVTAWLRGPGNAETVELRQDFVDVRHKGPSASFIDTLEPVLSEPLVQRVEIVDKKADGALAVKVTTREGADWFLVGNRDFKAPIGIRVTGPFNTDAKLAMVRINKAGVRDIMFAGGKFLEFGDGTRTVKYEAPDDRPFHVTAPVLKAISDVLPADYGQTVTGFEDNFDGVVLDSKWRVIGQNVFTLSNGVLRVRTAQGDANHLVYSATGYDPSLQEVLARIRITNFGTGDGPRAGIGVAIGADSQGINYHFRDEDRLGRHTEFLDDLRSWGPEFGFKWQTNAWYWMRLRHQPNTATGQPDVLAKVWLADGRVTEPATWQSWDYVPTRSSRSGFAGITAGSLGGTAEFEVNYFLLRAAGLPLIQIAPKIDGVGNLMRIEDQTVGEGSLLSGTVLASAANPPGQAATFSLDPGSPPGAAIDPRSGVFTWMPSEAQGPGTYPITVRVTDSGSPPLYDWKTVTVTVNEVNEAPVLAAIPDKNANVGSPLSFAAIATDSDLPANTLSFTLEPGAPAGATIDPVSAMFAWTPALAQARTTNLISVRVTDSGSPPLSDTKSFTIIVAAQPIVPAQLQASLLQNGNVRLTWTTAPGRSYTLQRSTDLADWQHVITINATSDSSEYVDTEASAAPARFYRVVQR